VTGAARAWTAGPQSSFSPRHARQQPLLVVVDRRLLREARGRREGHGGRHHGAQPRRPARRGPPWLGIARLFRQLGRRGWRRRKGRLGSRSRSRSGLGCRLRCGLQWRWHKLIRLARLFRSCRLDRLGRRRGWGWCGRERHSRRRLEGLGEDVAGRETSRKHLGSSGPVISSRGNTSACTRWGKAKGMERS
jgi:hypothetical protein